MLCDRLWHYLCSSESDWMNTETWYALVHLHIALCA
jgi:hypothetical protein